MQGSSALSLTPPSISRYSDSNLVEIAARVVEEFMAEQGGSGSAFSDGDDAFSGLESDETVMIGEASKEDKVKDGVEEEAEEKSSDGEEDFEFAFAPREMAFSPVSADEIFCNGQIRAIFPVSKRKSLIGEAEFLNGSSNSVAKSNYGAEQGASPTQSGKARLPLRELFTEEREAPSSCSSSEADELDGVPAETYCVWRPKSAEELSHGRCKKSNSTGLSKSWKFRDLLHRSNSDGKDAFVFLTSSFKKREDKKAKKLTTTEAPNPAGKSKSKGNFVAESAAAYQAKSGGDKRRSYLPYKQDLMEFFLY